VINHGPRLRYVTAAIASRSSHLQSPATGGPYAPRVHVPKLTEEREITPYTSVSPTAVTAAGGHVDRSIGKLEPALSRSCASLRGPKSIKRTVSYLKVLYETVRQVRQLFRFR
jgi:hypothetical protein